MADKVEQVEWISDYTGEDEDEAQVIITGKGIGGRKVALVYRDDDAQLIDRAVYYLRAINPSNPMAVAEGLGSAVKTLKEAREAVASMVIKYGAGFLPEEAPLIKKIDKALAAITKPKEGGD